MQPSYCDSIRVRPERPPVALAWEPRAIACADCGFEVIALSARTTRCRPCQAAAKERLRELANERLKAKRAKARRG